MKTLNFDEYSKNEIFGLFKSKKYEYDAKAKQVFNDMLNSIEDLDIDVFGDDRREVTFQKKDASGKDKPSPDETDNSNKPEEPNKPEKGGPDTPEPSESKPEQEGTKEPEENKPTEIVKDEKSAYPLMIKNLTALRDLLSQYKSISIEGEEVKSSKKDLKDMTSTELISLKEPEVELNKEEIQEIREVEVNVEKEAEKTFDEIYKELLSEWKEEQEKLGKNIKPGEGTRKRLKTLAKYKLLLIEWQKSQKEAGKNTKPGQGTRNRLMKIAKEWFDSMNPQKIGQFEVGKIYTYTNKKGEKKKVKLISLTHDTNLGKDKKWLTKDDIKQKRLAKGVASVIFQDNDGEYTSKSPEMAVSLERLSESFITSYSDFVNEAKFFGKEGKATIRKSETHLVQAFTKMRKSISILLDEKDKGVSITPEFLDSVISEKMKSKDVIVALYKEIWEHLHGKYKSTMPKLDVLFKENINIVKDKRKIVAEKIARFSLRSIQFDKENLYGGLATFGDSLEIFNETLKQILKYFDVKLNVVSEAKVNKFRVGQKQTTKLIQLSPEDKQEGRFKTSYTTSPKMDIAVMKGYSGHRTSSKFWGATKEDSYSLSINGKHFVSNVKGKEGEPLVNPKIAEMYYNFMTEIGNIQTKRKRNLMDESEYNSELSKIKTKYQAQLSKFK